VNIPISYVLTLMDMLLPQQVCTKCVMDTTVPGIRFDENGICTYCRIHDYLEEKHPVGESGRIRFQTIIDRIKKKGRGKEYDCIVGVSGGRDSSYTLYVAVEMGLRPLAVHFDNGWDSDIAVSNIKKITDKLDIDLHTHVADWEEFKDLQKAFLFASVSDAEVPTDYVILSVLYCAAKDNHVKYILNGHSFRTEGVAPIGWTYMDGRYIRGIQAKFGTKKITSFPIMSMSELLYYTLIKRIQVINVPEFIPYEHEKVNQVLKKELGWQYYGGHHHESVYTEFFQSYYLPKKFNIDKRKLEFSALIRSGQMKREVALQELKTPYQYNPEIVDYAVNKLGLSQEAFRQIMEEPPKSFTDYPSYYSTIRVLRSPIKLACNLNLLPHVFYEKYLGE
jgi:N-acetyl sugar amidotransferase